MATRKTPERKLRPPATLASEAAQIIPRKVRTRTDWTPTRIRNAERRADCGDIRDAVDICDWLLSDDRIRQALSSRVCGFTALPLVFEGDDNQVEALRIDGEGDAEWDAIFPLDAVKQVNYWGLLLNLGTGVFDWVRSRRNGGDRDIPIMRFYHPQPLSYDFDRQQWFRELNHGAAKETVDFGDGVWLGHTPSGSDRPWSMGLWRGLARWKLLKDYAIEDWTRVGETAARVVCTSDKENKLGQKPRAQLSSQIFNMSRESSIVLPAGFDMKVVALDATTVEIYNKQIEAANEAFSISIRGGNLTTNVSGGSRAAAQVQATEGDEANRTNDAKAWSKTARVQCLWHWAGSNYGEGTEPAKPVYKTEPDEDKKLSAETFNEALDGLEHAERLGLEVDRAAWACKYGVQDFIKPGEIPEPAEPPDPPNGGNTGSVADNATALHTGIGLSSGFAEGQEYADRLVETGKAVAAQALEPTAQQLEAEIDASVSIEDARARLEALYGTLDPQAMVDLLERGEILADMAGRAAVTQDV